MTKPQEVAPGVWYLGYIPPPAPDMLGIAVGSVALGGVLAWAANQQKAPVSAGPIAANR